MLSKVVVRATLTRLALAEYVLHQPACHGVFIGHQHAGVTLVHIEQTVMGRAFTRWPCGVHVSSAWG